jgi:hypothetical protein
MSLNETLIVLDAISTIGGALMIAGLLGVAATKLYLWLMRSEVG